MEAEVKEILLPKTKLISPSHPSLHETNFELKSYSSGLKWFFLDYSSLWKAGLSWSIFFLLNIGIPVISPFVFSCSDHIRAVMKVKRFEMGIRNSFRTRLFSAGNKRLQIGHGLASVPWYIRYSSLDVFRSTVTYFQHNRAGITVYGFTLDRSWLHTILALQLTLTLWILNKTIGIS